MISTEEKRKATFIDTLKGISWITIFLCLLGFFMGRVIFFDTFYTLGVAYVGAMYYNKQTQRWTSILTLLGILSSSSLNENMIKYMLMLLLLMGFRICMGMIKSQCNIKNQGFITGLSILCISMMSLVLGTPTVYKLIVCILETLIGVGLVGILSYSLNVIYKQRVTPLNEQEMASMAFLMACILGGMIDFYIVVPLIQKVFLKDVLVFVLIIGVLYLGGMSSGIVISLVISTLLVVISYIPPQFVAIYLFAALLGGIFCFLDRVGITFAMGLGLLLGFALFNAKVIDLPILGAYLVAAALSLCIPRSYLGTTQWFGYSSELEEEKHLVHVQQIITQRLKHFSKAFLDLSRTFDKISDKTFHFGQAEINYMIEDTGESMCQNCSMKNFCWKDYIKNTYQNAYKMIETIEQKGQITVGDIPDAFKKACINAESFAYTLGYKLDLFKQKRLWQKRFTETRSLITEQFEAVASSIANLSDQVESEFYFNKEDEKNIRQGLAAKGIRTKDIMVLENNGRKDEIHIYTHYKGEMDLKEKVIEIIENVLELKVEIERYEYHIEEKYCYFKLIIKKQFSILAAAAAAPKGEISGDVYSFMELADGKYLLALADGMGSGPSAKKQSTAAIELLESFMDSGFKNDTAVKMINSALVLKSDIENFSTMDITLIDEYTGVAEFLKLGASTSFIVRGDEITTVKVSSLPVGILEQIDIVSCKKQLKDGDLLIMVTDGVLESKEELFTKEETFKHFIRETHSTSPEYIANYLLEKTKNLLAGQECDDMTIVVARLWKQYE